MKDIQIRKSGYGRLTVKALTPKAKKIVLKQEPVRKDWFFVKAGEQIKVLTWAVSHGLSIDSDVPMNVGKERYFTVEVRYISKSLNELSKRYEVRAVDEYHAESIANAKVKKLKSCGSIFGGDVMENKNIIVEDDFFDTYKPQINHIVRSKTAKKVKDEDICSYNGCMYETYGEEEQYVRKMAQDKKTEKRVWTIMDCDGENVIGAGFHFVNRMGYIITEKEWVTGDEYVQEDD